MNTVFISDDNNTDRTILESALQKLGYEVVTFSDGTAILAAIRNHGTPLLIILDWMMPDLSGIDICRELKTNPPNIPLHTIIVTVRSEKSDTALALDSKADDFISKPYDAGELRARINSGCRQLESMVEREKMLENAQRIASLDSLGVLAGGIAHDFNNLMGGIFGYIDNSLDMCNDTRIQQNLSKAMNTIERARALTQQLLTFAKGGAPIQKISPMHPFIQETAQFALHGSNVSCRFDIAEGLWHCNIDKAQIGQVIDNLIINAQQAMPAGGTIDLTARNIPLAEKEHPFLTKGNYVKISVKDSGVGIPKELISRIFDPFFTTKEMGHGLGLATSYSIINRHGGCIDVESEPGKGSTFKVYLLASTELASAATKNIQKTHKGSGTFLIMDDEEVMRDTMEDMLEGLGYSVVSKENGKDAIEFFASETKANRKISGMIFDLTVPGELGGKAAIEEIRKMNTDIPAFVQADMQTILSW